MDLGLGGDWEIGDLTQAEPTGNEPAMAPELGYPGLRMGPIKSAEAGEFASVKLTFPVLAQPAVAPGMKVRAAPHFGIPKTEIKKHKVADVRHQKAGKSPPGEVTSTEFSHETNLKNRLVDEELEYNFESTTLSGRVELNFIPVPFIMDNNVAVIMVNRKEDYNPFHEHILKSYGYKVVNVKPTIVDQKPHIDYAMWQLKKLINEGML